MKKILFLLAAVGLMAAMFATAFGMVFIAVGLLGLAVDYLELIILAATIIVGCWLLKTLYGLTTWCLGIAATLSWFDSLKKSVAADEQQQQ